MNRSAAHHALKRDILLALGSRRDVRLFDNPRGFDERAKSTYGLCPGAADLVGLVRVDHADAHAALMRIEQGRFSAADFAIVRHALRPTGRFISSEVKTGKAVPNEQQGNFRDMVNDFGGSGWIVHSVEETHAQVDEARR